MYCGSALISRNFPHSCRDVFFFFYLFIPNYHFLSYKGGVFKRINRQIYKFDPKKKTAADAAAAVRLTAPFLF